MNQLFTKQELLSKGITKKDIVRMLKRSEKRVNFYFSQYITNGQTCSESIQKSWNNECAKWDHLKTTLAIFEN